MTYFRSTKKSNMLNKKCPECTKALEAVSDDKELKKYKCNYCKSEITVTKLKIKKNKKTKKLKNDIVIIDRSNERTTKMDKEEKKEPIEKEAKEVNKETYIDDLKESLENTKLVTITYQSKSGTSTRTVEPYKLMRDKNNDICLYGYCLNAKGIRHFKLKNLQGITFEDAKYEARWPVEIKI